MTESNSKESLFGALRVGDRVEVNWMGDSGNGTITEISDKLERGGGTTSHKAFWVETDHGIEGWFYAFALTKIR